MFLDFFLDLCRLYTGKENQLRSNISHTQKYFFFSVKCDWIWMHSGEDSCLLNGLFSPLFLMAQQPHFCLRISLFKLLSK